MGMTWLRRPVDSPKFGASLPAVRPLLTVAGCAQALAGCADHARLIVTQSAPAALVVPVQAAGQPAPTPVFALHGMAMGPADGSLSATTSNDADATGPARALKPVAGARVTVVGVLGDAVGIDPTVTDAEGRYTFAPTGPLPAIVFVRVDYQQDGRPVALYAPLRLTGAAESRQVPVVPATTLVAKKLKAMVLQRSVALEDVDAQALARSASLIAPSMSERDVALAVTLGEDRAGQLLDSMLKASPALAGTLGTVWRPTDFMFQPTQAFAPGSSGASAPPGPTRYSLWDDATRPVVSAAADVTAGIELGLKFRAKVDGDIVGIRFYKDTTNTGLHVANLWTLDGTLLATAPFTAETASGWQRVAFAAPVAIAANCTYVASYHTTNGNYAYDDAYFAAAGRDTTALQAPAAGIVEGNAVYAYNAASTYPGTVSVQSWNYWVDVVLSAYPEVANPGATSIWASTAAPSVSHRADTTANELGVKFRSDVAGLVTGIRFYKHAPNAGPHVGTLWRADGTRLATANFTGETASGWQQVTFPQPVAIAANTTYVASYYAPAGNYAYDWYYFNGLNRRNGPLVALADGTDGVNGLYDAGGMTFPTANNGKQTNYWVDVAFSQAAAPATPASVSLWNRAAAPPGAQADAGDVDDYELGTRFTPAVNGQVTGVRFYKAPGNVGPHVASLWSTAAPGAPLATAAFAAETASGWQEVAFAAPVAVSAGTTYVASYACPSGHYPATPEYFLTGMDTGLLQAPAGAGVFNATPGAYPASAFANTNYWVEPTFSP